MTIHKKELKNFIAFGDAVREALSAYDVDKNTPGQACARGTLTARFNSFRTIASALEAREPSEKDCAELKAAINTFNWLKSDSYVTKDFADLEITVAQTVFADEHPDTGIVGSTSFDNAMTVLIRAVESVVLT